MHAIGVPRISSYDNLNMFALVYYADRLKSWISQLSVETLVKRLDYDRRGDVSYLKKRESASVLLGVHQ